MPDEGRDPGRSILFERYQNPVLAAEAREMSMAFADFSYLRRLSGEQDPDRAWEGHFAHTQPQVRRVLDGLLATFPPEEQERAVALAGSVEAFVLPSAAVESRVFENPGEATGYLIGISPIAVQLTGEIAWGLNSAHPYMAGALPTGWEAATMHAQESLALNINGYMRALEGAGDAPVPLGMLNLALADADGPGRWSHARGPRDFYDAATTFALAHELAHIGNGDLLPAENRRATALLSERIAPLLRISDQENEELTADAATFTSCFNYLLGTWLMMNERPTGLLRALKRLQWKAQLSVTAWHSARRATEACEAYYSAIAILSDISFRRGDDDTASRLMTTATRVPFVQYYVQHMREEVLAPSYGPFMWTDEDVLYRKAHHSWRVYFLDALLPQTSRHQRPDLPDWLASLKTPGDLSKDPDVLAGVAAVWEEKIPDLEREMGADHPETLSARAHLAHLRGEAQDFAGSKAVLEELLVDAERVAGADDRSTLGIRHNLACMRARSGDVAGAAAAFRELLADQERVFGPDDPEVLDTRYELAWLRGESGDAAAAAAAFVELSADYERALGPGHAATLATRNSLAHWRDRAGDAPGAAAASTEARTHQHPALSPDHPDTLPAYEARLEEQERLLGAGHPDALTTRWFLAILRGRAGDASGAAAAYAELLEHDLAPLAFDDVDLRILRDNADYWRGRAEGAERTVE
ncbi:GTP-binding protein [Streptomyces sp. NPDC002285]